MITKSILSTVLPAYLALALLCSPNNQSIKNISENSLKKQSVQTRTTDSINTTLQKKPLINVTIKGITEKFFDKAKDINVFVTAIKKGTPKKNIPSDLKPPSYFAYFHYSNNENVEYFLYLGQSNGWIYRNGTNEAYTLTKSSVQQLNYLISRFTQDDAIEMVVKYNPKFPNKVGVRKGEEGTGGPIGAKATVEYVTKVKKKSNNTFIVTLTKAWNLSVNAKKPVSFWEYNVTPQKVTLINKNIEGENLVNSMK